MSDQPPKRGRIENLKPWKPGQSGNPGGRPKRRPISDAYEKVAGLKLPEDLRVKLGLPKGSLYRDAIAIQQIRAAIKGNSPAAKEIREAIEGKATQRVELVGGEDAPPVGIVYELVDHPKPPTG